MIVDAVVANDEIDLAKFRISYLSTSVSKFYIGESEQTFQGRAKPLNFGSRVTELRALGADVEVIEIPVSPDDSLFADAWERGRYQRYWFLQLVASRHPDATIIFSDIDEVPSHQQVTWASENLGPDAIASLPMVFVFRYLNWLLEPHTQDYRPAVILKGTAFRPNIRDGGFPATPGEKGAHLSYVGFGAEQVREKFSSFEHTELDLEHLYRDGVLEFADEWGIDHIGRPGQPGFGLLRGALPQQMKSVLLAAWEMFPSWHRDFPRKPLIRRIVASSSLSSYRSSGDVKYLDDPSLSSFSVRFLRHLVNVVTHTIIRLTRTGQLVKRLQRLFQKMADLRLRTH
jgi:hypothetical protein